MATSAEQWLKGANAATNSRDMDQLLSFYTDDCIWDNVAAGSVLNGKDELRNYFNDLFKGFPDFKADLKSYFSSGNQICIESVVSGTYKQSIPNFPPPTGKFYSVRSVRVIELKEGKANRTTVYLDMATMMRQLGLLPPPPEQLRRI